jgi:hypothetical protein
MLVVFGFSLVGMVCAMRWIRACAAEPAPR